MNDLYTSSEKDTFLRRQTFGFLFILLFAVNTFGYSQDDVLLTIHDREITRNEFLYHFHKTDQEINQKNLAEFLESFIDFHLKLAQARQERLDQTYPFINELTDYRLQLASPYLTDKEKEEEFVREAADRLSFEVNASQILVKLDQHASPEDTLKAYLKAIQLRKRIINGKSFANLSNSVSDNPKIAITSPIPGYFTAFQTKYTFESAAYKLEPGEVSMPVRTNEGYHIIQLNDKRKNESDQKSEPEILQLIYEAEDQRTIIIENTFVNKLKKDWSFKENLDALELIYDLADERIYRGNWTPPADRTFNETLFWIDGKNVYQRDFIEFLTEFETTSSHISTREYILLIYQQFVSSRLITYTNYMLAEKYPEFRYQLQEYRDAMLLLAITRRKVLVHVESDSTGLKNFYTENIEKYKWGERLFASVFTAVNEQSAKRATKISAKYFAKGSYDIIQLINQINNKLDGQLVKAEQGKYLRGEHPVIDQIEWEKGYSGIKSFGDNFQFVYIHYILKPEYKSMDEAYETLIVDFQNYLTKIWIEELRRIYNIKIDLDVLSSIE